jgi:leucyl/phenylalanyl-tRNA---protein transferase
VTQTHAPLPWLEPGAPFPDVATAWGPDSEAPGLLAAGNALTPGVLKSAYSQGIFPWFSDGQPVLWWSPDPRMVLQIPHFKLHRSLRKTLQRFAADSTCEIRIDSAFRQVITHCAQASRRGQGGTWIVPEMVEAYCALHTHGTAHSVETWRNGQLVGGLYCVALGKAVFGESMFALQTDASKIALAALVALCRSQGVEMVDCQQNTAHLGSLGAAEMPRRDFAQHLRKAVQQDQVHWHFSPLYWENLRLADGALR